MNILYISQLTGNLWAGPNNSVPAQIRAQSEIDNVFWYNINNVKREEWSSLCNNLSNYPSGRLKALPSPFNYPDIAVIEEVYCYPFSKIIQDLQAASVPYILIPRSTLTKQAQTHKPLKKIIGNQLYFNRMISRAVAVQFLTEQEKFDSGECWNQKSLVIPNGINLPIITKENFNSDRYILTYVGRIEIYQKGLDMLLEACRGLNQELKEANCVIKLYGPDRENALQELKDLVSKYQLENVIEFHDGVFGQNKENVLLESDAFIMTSRFEGHPMGMIEALAYGLPCLATEGTNISRKIVEYDAGWDAGNTVESIKTAILKMLNERERLPQKSRNAVRLAATYSWDIIAQKTHAAFEEIIKEVKK